MRKNAFTIDTETCGFHGLATLIQYAYEDGDIHLFEPWRRPVHETLDIIEQFTDKTCVFFNAAFDMFHLCKMYTAWRLLPKDAIPCNLPVLQVAEAERDGRDGPCLKPRACVDLMLHSRKSELQMVMSRHDIRVNKVPIQNAERLCRYLEDNIEFDGILFAKRKDQNAPKWKCYERILRRGGEESICPDFQDVVLKFRPDRGLKQLARHCLKLDPRFNSFRDVYPEREVKVGELGYAPFALGVSSPEKDWRVTKGSNYLGKAWPAQIHIDIEHWATNEEARSYGYDDVKYTRLLDGFFNYPEADDDDSALACMVAAVRWHGYDIDVPKLEGLMVKAQAEMAKAPVCLTKPPEVRGYIREVMDETEALLIDKSTKKANLEKIRETHIVEKDDLDVEIDMVCTNCKGSKTITVGKITDNCPRCDGVGKEPGGETCIRCDGVGCTRCSGRGYLLLGRTPAAQRADELLRCKFAAKEVELYTKLLRAGRFHAAFKVIGTLSSRMSGTGGLNAQGIKNDKAVRSAFPLKWEGMALSGGDFDGFEVTLADAVFGDANLRKDLLAGASIHTLMARELYPDKTEEQILLSKGHKDGGDVDMYSRGKQAVFAFLYGGDETTINKKLSIPLKIAKAAMDNLQSKYPGIAKSRERVEGLLRALNQSGDIGTNILWSQPEDKITSFLGFSRYFGLENRIIKELHDLSQELPEEMRFAEGFCVRRQRKQTVGGATNSALYGAAFNIQAANIRAANNHLIQSPGAMITKELQRRIWDLQPSGIHPWHVAPMNVHDEVLVVCLPTLVEEIGKVVIEVVEGYRDRVPLIGMEWARDMKSWGEKGKVDLGIKPSGIVDLRDDSYVPPVDIQELDWLDEQPIYFDFDEDGSEWI